MSSLPSENAHPRSKSLKKYFLLLISFALLYFILCFFSWSLPFIGGGWILDVVQSFYTCQALIRRIPRRDEGANVGRQGLRTTWRWIYSKMLGSYSRTPIFLWNLATLSLFRNLPRFLTAWLWTLWWILLLSTPSFLSSRLFYCW